MLEQTTSGKAGGEDGLEALIYGFFGDFLFRGTLVVGGELFGDFVGDVGAGADELAAEALLGGGPDDVALLIYQADGGYGFMLAFLGPMRFALAESESGVLMAAGSPARRGA